MKTKSFGLFAAILAISAFLGCTTTGEPDIARIAAVSQEATRIGTREAVFDHPEWRSDFVTAQQQLAILAQQQGMTVNDLLRVISQLPVSELSGRTGRVVLDSARLVIVAANWSGVEIVRTEQLRPVAQALSDGIGQGLAEPATRTTSIFATKHYKIRQ